jgi:non-ribosomal peptide synthetase component E (peptide arylation enzyme)
MHSMDLNVWRIFEGVSAAVPQRPAVIQADRTLTYGELAEPSRRPAVVLHAHGLGCHAELSALGP